MPRELKSVDDRVEWLAEEILLLKESINFLTNRVNTIEQGGIVIKPASQPVDTTRAPALTTHSRDMYPTNREQESWTVVGQEVLLPWVAAVSFMLVVALILRTITDNGMIDLVLGSFVGMGYSLTLILAGGYLFKRGSKLAPVFPACGVLLMFAILLETRANFDSLTSLTAYIILMAVNIIVIEISLRCKSKALLFLTVFGSIFVGVAIDFPTPFFAMLGVLVLVNTIAALRAASKKIATSLPWYTLGLALVFWMFWAYKLNFALRFRPDEVLDIGLHVFLPLLFLFWSYYTGSSLKSAMTHGLHLSAFFNILPAFAAGGTFFALLAVAVPWLGGKIFLGWMTVLASAVYMALVAWLARKGRDDVPGGKEFVTAATILLIQGLSISVSSSLWALPIWAVAASVLTISAQKWRSGGIRVISYMFHVFILGMAIKHQNFAVEATPWGIGLVVAGTLALISIMLYNWCRNTPPQCDSAFFALFDKKDRTAVILLVIGLYEAFCMVRFMTYGVMGIDSAGDFSCVQSIIVNFGIVSLLLIGLKARRKEILVVAGCAILVAAIKVFIFDLLNGSGLPLVLSVFSFGVVAVVSSLVLKKWGDRADYGTGQQQEEVELGGGEVQV